MLNYSAQGKFGKWHSGSGREYRKAFLREYLVYPACIYLLFPWYDYFSLLFPFAFPFLLYPPPLPPPCPSHRQTRCWRFPNNDSGGKCVARTRRHQFTRFMEGRCTGSKRRKRLWQETEWYSRLYKRRGWDRGNRDVGAEAQIHRQAALHVCPPRGRILGRNPDKIHKSFPPCYSQSPLQLCLEIVFLQTHATSYSF